MAYDYPDNYVPPPVLEGGYREEPRGDPRAVESFVTLALLELMDREVHFFNRAQLIECGKVYCGEWGPDPAVLADTMSRYLVRLGDDLWRDKTSEEWAAERKT